jgi:release factor glutamine methyltransferase
VSDPQVEARLRAAGCVWAEDEAALLEEAAASPGELESLVARRVAGEPLETVLGWVEFLGRRLVVAAGVFVPRRRTELLARTALERARAVPVCHGRPVVVEMCCGVAPVAASLEGAPAEVHASDVSAAALGCAGSNAPSAALHLGDLYDALPAGLLGRVGVLAANAPYVPSDRVAAMPPEARDHEPLVALDGGVDGVDLHRRIAADAARWLAPGGVLLVETSRSQASLTTAAMAAAGLATHVVADPETGGCVAVGVQDQSMSGAGVTIPISASASSICSREMPSR